MCGEIALIVPNLGTKSAIGTFPKGSPTRRTVLCRDGGISRSEWNAAGQNGHKPALKVIVSFLDYNGEQEAEYNGKVYSIYRTYPVNNDWDVELYLEEKVGVTL